MDTLKLRNGRPESLISIQMTHEHEVIRLSDKAVRMDTLKLHGGWPGLSTWPAMMHEHILVKVSEKNAKMDTLKLHSGWSRLFDTLIITSNGYITRHTERIEKQWTIEDPVWYQEDVRDRSREAEETFKACEEAGEEEYQLQS